MTKEQLRKEWMKCYNDGENKNVPRIMEVCADWFLSKRQEEIEEMIKKIETMIEYPNGEMDGAWVPYPSIINFLKEKI